MNNEIITLLDWLLAPFYILIIFVFAIIIKNKGIKKKPIYKFFIPGLLAKVFGGISACLIYVYYYKQGGDTLAYHSSAEVLVNLLFQNPNDFLKIWLGPATADKYYIFTNLTGYPIYYYNDFAAYNVVRFIFPLELLALKRYILASILMAVVSYSGVWKLYSLFCEIYPSLEKRFALAILFFPSLIFWGSGIFKDSWTLSAACWFCVSFYRIFIQGKIEIYNIVSIVVSAIVMILIKPYIFISMVPACLLWMIWGHILGIRNFFLRIIAGPIIVLIGFAIGAIVWLFVNSELGAYSSIDSMVKKAKISSDDLKQDYYQGNSFDLGDYEPTLGGMLIKFPEATMAGLFRPYIWETKNIAMFMSGIETLILLLFVISLIVMNPRKAMQSLLTNPMVLFCLVYAIVFAFSVAISTSNFGALVRLRIPMIPFFVSGLMIIAYEKKQSLRS